MRSRKAQALSSTFNFSFFPLAATAVSGPGPRKMEPTS
jgi:hypothetical protein